MKALRNCHHDWGKGAANSSTKINAPQNGQRNDAEVDGIGAERAAGKPRLTAIRSVASSQVIEQGVRNDLSLTPTTLGPGDVFHYITPSGGGYGPVNLDADR